jgi:saccharopine dehydrogenase-like NADP-dependent oxidoreductase
MRILLVGAGGVGTASARIAARRPSAQLVIADCELGRAQRAAAARDGYEAVRLDARDEQATGALLAERRCDVLMNATDPRFVMPLFRAALAAGTHYLDMELIDAGAWSGTGVLGPEALPPRPFLDLLTEYGSPWECEERTPSQVSE